MSLRTDKVDELIRDELSVILHADFPDEIVTINFVCTARDLHESKIYFSITSDRKSVYDRIISSSGKYWGKLSSVIKIRRLPKLILIRDSMRADVEKVEALIEENRTR